MAHLSINNTEGSDRSRPASGESDQVGSPHSSPSRSTSTAASCGSCARSGVSRSPPKDHETGARHRSEESYAIRKWFGEKGRWLYTEHVFPDGTSVVVKGERPDDVMGNALRCENGSAAKGNDGGRGSGRFEETDGSRQGSVASMTGSAGSSSASEEMERNDSGLSFTSKSKSLGSLERAESRTKTSPSPSRKPLQHQALTYGTFTTDLEAGRGPHRLPERRPVDQAIGRVPWFEFVLVIAWLMFVAMFVKTMFLRKEMYGCYWACSGSLIRKVE
ncbi:hypothetical protein Tdes44962_MAKER06037 [Teratosphaeria destructans]|uniref:Uncharacterized protein n=1 Tax=Teratosphaeria destructans TaxID=418781 RepID=A0A9W7VYD2_9PEZI|nr:hypothetical protein Tdes44962_MAKER06037 [Teratosphaeria destructans]